MDDGLPISKSRISKSPNALAIALVDRRMVISDPSHESAVRARLEDGPGWASRIFLPALRFLTSLQSYLRNVMEENSKPSFVCLLSFRDRLRATCRQGRKAKDPAVVRQMGGPVSCRLVYLDQSSPDREELSRRRLDRKGGQEMRWVV